MTLCANDIVIHPPVRGYWATYNPPGHPALAFDFLAEDEHMSLYRKGGFARHLISFISVEDTFTWSRPVFSPVDGVVVACVDDVDDRKRICFTYDLVSLLVTKRNASEGFEAFGGNHIMIRAGDFYVLLCHLKNGAATVHRDDSVKIGQQIGEVGNSGSSIQPHLHIQVMSNDQYFPLFANLLPFRFDAGKVKRNGGWLASSSVRLENRGHYSFE